MGDKLKSAYELALERLGMAPPEDSLTEEQKKRISEIRAEYKAKRAEREIMLQSELAKIMTNTAPEKRAATMKLARERYEKELNRLREEEARKVAEVRGEEGA
jgi:hypothetical protein